MAFDTFQLDARVLRAVRDLGYEQPTPIQREAIPLASGGRDLLACAMTGSGKTAAFLLPIIQRLLDRPRGRTRALVVTPTRELAAQIEQSFRDLAAHTPLSVAAVFGGVGMGPQEEALRRGVDVVVATPGRLLDHMKEPYTSFAALEVLVLDEADRMLDMGFLPDIRRILSQLPRQRQTLLFSATMPGPIASLAAEMLKDPVRIDVERQSKPATGVEQAVYPVAQELKPALLLELLRREHMDDTLVFTRTKHRANRVAEFLVKHGVRADRIHGNRSQPQRTQALAAFKAGTIQVLVATDIAARGIDIDQLGHVVNFDVPTMSEDYIHRVGRTARAEATGDAITFVSPEEEGDFAQIERAIGKRVPRQTLPGFDYKARTAEKLEVPIAERIAAIRARKAEERARAKAKAERRAAAERSTSESGRRREERRPAPAGRPAPPRSSAPRTASEGGAPYRGEPRRDGGARRGQGSGRRGR
jgi:ATP-dependent RNA helicase RhlE